MRRGEEIRVIKQILFWLLLVAGSLIISLCIKGTAYSMEKSGSEDKEFYYRSIEKNYIEDVKKILNEVGYKDAGVMLTKTVDIDGKRDYLLSIHHRRPVTDEVLEAIDGLSFPIYESSISVMTTM